MIFCNENCYLRMKDMIMCVKMGLIILEMKDLLNLLLRKKDVKNLLYFLKKSFVIWKLLIKLRKFRRKIESWY